MTNALYTRLRKTLEKDRKALAKSAKELEPFDKDFAESQRAEAAVLARVIAKIDDGTYNVCSKCNGTITDERLAALPAAELCAKCAGEKSSKQAKPKVAAKSPKKPPRSRPSRAKPAETKMSVWVDSDDCIGSGECVRECPTLFVLGKDKTVRVKDGKKLRTGPDTLVVVPPELHDKVTTAATECPSECIFLEFE